MPIYTDAPSDWPALEMTGLGVNHHLNAVNIAKGLTGEFNRGTKYQVSSFLESIFLDQGILQTHMTVTSSENRYYLFFFNENEELSSRFYSGIKYLFSQSPNIESVYYSNFQLKTDVKPALPLREFGPDLLTKLGKSVPAGSYSVWKSDYDNDQFSKTREFDYIGEFQSLSDGIHSYLLAEILRYVKDIEDNIGRVELPEEEYSLALVGPENKPFILSASKKQGLMFHFNEEKVSSRYRTLFWKHFNQYLKGLREYIITNDIELDRYSGMSPFETWQNTSHDIMEKEGSGNNIERFGLF